MFHTLAQWCSGQLETETSHEAAERREEEERQFLLSEEAPQEDYKNLGNDEHGDPKSAWLRRDGAGLEPLMEHALLLDVRWLLDLGHRRGAAARFAGVLPPWQQLPPEARASRRRMRLFTFDWCLPIIALSYPWHGRHHPDEKGVQLQALLPLLEVFVRLLNDWGGEACTGGVLWDFAAFPQFGWTADPRGVHVPYTEGDERFREIHPGRFDDRTDAQLQRFSAGLKSINQWYVHPYVVVVRFDPPIPGDALNTRPLEARGWCIFEEAVSGLIKNHDNLLLFSRFNAASHSSWEDVCEHCKGARRAPMDPDAFSSMMTEGVERETIAFTAGSDLQEVVLPNYERGFVRAFSDVEKISYADLQWGDEEAASVAAALRYSKVRGVGSGCKKLYMDENNLGNEGATAVVSAVADGCLPNLEKLNLNRNVRIRPDCVDRCVAMMKTHRPSVEFRIG